MTYENTASTMILTRNCLALATSEATVPVGFLKSEVTYCNGNSSIIDLLTGKVTIKSLYRKQPKHNRVNDNPKAYEITPVLQTRMTRTGKHCIVTVKYTSSTLFYRSITEVYLMRLIKELLSNVMTTLKSECLLIIYLAIAKVIQSKICSPSLRQNILLSTEPCVTVPAPTKLW